MPRNKSFNVQLRTKIWAGITIRQIAEEIAGRAGIALYYEADDIGIEIIGQNEEMDCKFLYSVCADYGLAMKAVAPSCKLRYLFSFRLAYLRIKRSSKQAG